MLLTVIESIHPSHEQLFTWTVLECGGSVHIGQKQEMHPGHQSIMVHTPFTVIYTQRGNSGSQNDQIMHVLGLWDKTNMQTQCLSLPGSWSRDLLATAPNTHPSCARCRICWADLDSERWRRQTDTYCSVELCEKWEQYEWRMNDVQW